MSSKATDPTEIYKAIFDHSPVAFLLADDNGCFVDVNPAGEELFDTKRSDLIGKKISDFVAPMRVKDTEKLWSRFRQEGYQLGYFRISRTNGIDRIIRYVASSNILPGLHLSIARDVTDTDEMPRESW